MTTDLLAFVGIGISAFVVTNIDDIFVLMLFFSSGRFHMLAVVVGQFLGIGTLVAISALGSLLALVVPPIVIGLLGIAPISIGVVRLLQLRKHQKEPTSNEIGHNWGHHLSLLPVVAVTISNGGDNIGIYVPLFAKYNTAIEITILSTIFMIMTGVWCLIDTT